MTSRPWHEGGREFVKIRQGRMFFWPAYLAVYADYSGQIRLYIAANTRQPRNWMPNTKKLTATSMANQNFIFIFLILHICL
jgi:uncharacterized membrane protein